MGAVFRKLASIVDPALCAPIPIVILGTAKALVSQSFDVIQVASGVFLIYFFSLIVTVVVGLPAFFLLDFLKLARWWTAGAVGLVVGVLATVLLRSPDNSLAYGFFATAFAGLCAGLVFWAVWSSNSGGEKVGASIR
jgi:hypothetical protein